MKNADNMSLLLVLIPAIDIPLNLDIFIRLYQDLKGHILEPII